MPTIHYVLETAECDPKTGTIILHLRGRPPLRLTGSRAALRALKAAVIDSWAHPAPQPRPPKKAPEREPVATSDAT